MATTTAVTPIVTKEHATIGTVSSMLQQYKGQIAAALPKHMTPERVIRIALTALSQTPRLLECDPRTICGAVVMASALGLEPSSPLGECFLVPFWNKKAKGGKGGQECQLILGYHGKIKLMNNTGELLGINAQVVRENDEFEFDDGLDPFVKHRYHHIKDRGPVIGYWAGVSLKSGFKRIAYMSKSEAEQHRDKFAMTRTKEGKVFGVWADDFDAMALKTAIHKASKYVPKSTIVQTAWNMEDRAEAGLPQSFSIEVPLELQQSGAEDPSSPTVEMPMRASEQKAITAMPEPMNEKPGTIIERDGKQFTNKEVAQGRIEWVELVPA